jgi:hypothetical protein
VARPWLITRVVDPMAKFLCVPADQVLSVALGPLALLADDQACLAAGLPVYDALYAWCRSATGERHQWSPPG